MSFRLFQKVAKRYPKAALKVGDFALKVAVLPLAVLCIIIISWLFALKFASKEYIAPVLDDDSPDPDTLMASAPSAVRAVMPILVPIVLIVLRSLSNFPTKPFGQGNLATFIDFLGQPTVALLIGVFIAFTLPSH